MGKLHDLPGVKGVLEPVGCGSRSAVLREIRRNRAVMAASDDGCVIVWIDDAGKTRASFQRHYAELSHQICESRKQLATWLRNWWWRMEEFHGGTSPQ